MKDAEYMWTTGAMIDKLQDGEIAEYCDAEGGTAYVVKRGGNIYFGADTNAIVQMNYHFLNQKWRITGIFEQRVCDCCEAALKPGNPAYVKSAKLAHYGHREYNEHRGDAE